MTQKISEPLVSIIDTTFKNIATSRTLGKDLPELKEKFISEIHEEMKRTEDKSKILTETIQRLLDTESTVNFQEKIQKLFTIIQTPFEYKKPDDIISQL